MLGNSLGSIIKSNDPDAFEAVETLRKYGQEWRKDGGDEDAFEKMVADVAKYDTNKLLWSPGRSLTSSR